MTQTWSVPDLRGKVAVVAGSTRGAGRGIATELGAAGATVICTGRSVRGNIATAGRGETIDETAEIVTAAGGHGIPVRTDHTDPEQVRALFDRVRADHGRLDVLVNDVWGGDELTQWNLPFWELDLRLGLTMQERAVWSHAITARLGAPLMIERGAGLIVEVTDGDSPNYRGNLFYDLAKSSAIRLALAMSGDLRARRVNVTALALTPGFLRSEAMLDHFGVREDNWQDATARDPYFAESETPRFIGRAVTSLAADPRVHEKAGRALATWHLAREYGFRDVDGRQPHWQEFFDRKQAEAAAQPPGHTEAPPEP